MGPRSASMKFDQALVRLNQIGLELVQGAERGPTPSSRFFKILNRAIQEARQDLGARQDTTRTSWLAFVDQDESLTSYAISISAQELISNVGINLLSDEYLENRWEVSEGTGIGTDNPAKFGNDDSAEEQKVNILTSVSALVDEAREDIVSPFAKLVAEFLGKSAAKKIIEFSKNDSSDQDGQFQGASSYKIDHWIEDQVTGPLLERPVSSSGQPIKNNQFDYNFYDETKWRYANFNPNLAVASLGDGFSVSDKGVLSTTNNANKIAVNPAVASGQTRITDSWQSISDWGIFPTIDDGGTQIPLTPHWGDVSVYSYDHARDYKPDSFVVPYDSNGSLNQSFVSEARELVLLSESLQHGQEGAANKRAIAEYWEYGDGTAYPPGHWIELANTILQDKDVTLSSQEKMDLILAVSHGVSDAGAIGWGIKYEHDTVRPFTAINQLFLGSVVPDWEGNELAQVDDRKGWNPYQLRRNYTPPFPDIVSGHSAFSYASAVVLRNTLGSNYYPSESRAFISRFSDKDGFDGLASNGNEERTLKWTYFSQQAEEAGFSRMLGGIHMASGNLEGMKLGITIGHRVLERIKIENEVGLLSSEITKTLDDRVPELVFGTLDSDFLIGVFSGNDASGQIYGFDGDDIIGFDLADGAAPESIDIFGGSGNDRFLIIPSSSTLIRIADYEDGEVIEISRDLSIKSLQEIEVETLSSASGLGFTRVSAGERLLFELDGIFNNSHLLESIQIV